MSFILKFKKLIIRPYRSYEKKRAPGGSLRRVYSFLKNVWHVLPQPKVWFDQNFRFSLYNENMQKKSFILKMSRTFVLRYNDAEKLLTYS